MDNFNQLVNDPTIYSVIKAFQAETFAKLNVMRIGVIDEVLADNEVRCSITNKKLMPYFHTQLNQFLQKEVNIMASSIAYFKNNNITDLSLFTMLDNNAKQLINLYSTYTNVKTDDLYNSFINLYKLILNSCNYAKLVSLNCSYNALSFAGFSFAGSDITFFSARNRKYSTSTLTLYLMRPNSEK